LKGTFRLDGSGPGLMGLSCEVRAESEEGVSTTKTPSRSYLFVASNSATVMEGLRSHAGPIERLTMNRQSANVTKTAVRANVHKALNVCLNFTAQITLDLVLFLKNRGDQGNFLIRQIFGSFVRINVRLFQNILGRRAAYTVKVGQSDPVILISWDINTHNTRHNLNSFFSKWVFQP
jgi:hypothetical protein